MKEAEVSLRVALYYIKHHLTEQDVRVSIDGAHVKTGNTVHFDIVCFLKEQGCVKVEGSAESWQGTYEVKGFFSCIIISSVPGMGDVNINTGNGKHLWIESKKGKEKNKSNSEYSLMREAIGQLMTGCELTDNVVPIVAVPYTEKSFELACRWSQIKQMKQIGIRFILVHAEGEITYV